MSRRNVRLPAEIRSDKIRARFACFFLEAHTMYNSYNHISYRSIRSSSYKMESLFVSNRRLDFLFLQFDWVM